MSVYNDRTTVKESLLIVIKKSLLIYLFIVTHKQTFMNFCHCKPHDQVYHWLMRLFLYIIIDISLQERGMIYRLLWQRWEIHILYIDKSSI